MIEETTDAQQANLWGFLGAIRRRWGVILACLIVVPAAAYGYTRTEHKQYSASASVLLTDPSFQQDVAGSLSQSPASADQGTTLATETSIASLPQVADSAARRLGPPYATSGLPGSVSASSDGTSNVLTITAKQATPTLAAKVANVYAAAYIDFRQKLDVQQITQARNRILAQLPAVEGRVNAIEQAIHGTRGSQAAQLSSELSTAQSAASFLRQRSAQLNTLVSLQDGDAQLAQPATPPGSPSSPRVARTVGAGVGLGLLLGLLLVMAFELLDRRLRSPTDVREVLDAPILGAIPQSAAIASPAGGQVRLERIDRESFAMVYANLSNFNSEPISSVLVTSATPGDGKSTVAWNLAVSAATVGLKVLLIEADMRHPTLAGRLKVDVTKGLSDILRGELEFYDALHQVAIGDQRTNGHAFNGNGNGNGKHGGLAIDVMFAGPPPESPTALLASERMRDLIGGAESVYDLVVIDTPPTTVVSDAIPLVKHVTGVLIVTRMRKNTREGTLLLRDQLEHLRARTLGVVVNGVDQQDGYYGSVSTYLRDYVPSAT